MSQERASERFHRLVYSHMMATTDSREKAWSYIAENHKSLYAEYCQEQTIEEATITAANEAETARKQKAANDRRDRQTAINSAVEERMRLSPGIEYHAAFNSVRREKPHLFAGLQEPPCMQAANAAAFSHLDR